MFRRVLVAIAAATTVSAAGPAVASAAQPADGPLTAFYAAPAGAKKASQGKLLRKGRLPADQLLDGAGRGWKVLYASRGYRGQRIVVSGQVFVPRGQAPKGGWPVISYAHGTVGLLNRCAPSYRHDLPAFLGEYLKAGFAFVATDYEGLGPAGPHPYLNGTSEAYGQTDIVRAARQTTKGLSRKWMAVGQSQGGQATLFTAARATRLAPELDFRGAIATAPPSHWRSMVTDTTDTGRVLTPLVLDGLTFFNPDIDPVALLTDDGRRLLNAVYSGCLADTVLSVFPSVMDKPLTVASPADGYKLLKPAFDKLEPPITKLDQPTYISDGAQDEFVPTATVVSLARELRANGSKVALGVFPGVDHRGTARSALKLGIPFARKQFGRSIYSKLDLAFTRSRPHTQTSFTFTSALPASPADLGSPALRKNAFRFPAGTTLDPQAVPACQATDADLASRGVAACPATTQVGTGSADVKLGTGGTLTLRVTAFNASGGRLAIALNQPDGTVIRILRPKVAKRTVTTTLPKVALGADAEASLTRFSLRLGGGRPQRPVIRTPATCPAGGHWTIAYTSTYDAPIGTQTIKRTTPCRQEA
ncbi:MAG: alpha/beta hydrolase family protein [Solirubrobacteraceae bacterium]